MTNIANTYGKEDRYERSALTVELQARIARQINHLVFEPICHGAETGNYWLAAPDSLLASREQLSARGFPVCPEDKR